MELVLFWFFNIMVATFYLSGEYARCNSEFFEDNIFSIRFVILSWSGASGVFEGGGEMGATPQEFLDQDNFDINNGFFY
jgi:hypothetical protein